MLDCMPTRIIAGTTSACRLSCGYSPQEGWALTLALRGGGTPADVAGVADDDGFVVELPTSLTVGRWWWQAKVTNGAETYVPLQGEMLVEPNIFDEAGTYDGRSEARQALEAIEAVLANKATADQQSYSINGRSLQRCTVAELLKLRAFFVAKIGRERGRSGWRRIGVRF